MARMRWELRVYNGGSVTEITTMTAFTMMQGLRHWTDPYSAASVVITGKDISSVQLSPAIELGDQVFLKGIDEDDTGSPKYAIELRFNLTDLQLQYGVTEELDTWTMTASDMFAILGRATIDVSWGATTTGDAINQVNVAAGLASSTYPSCLTPVSAQTLTNVNALQVFQQLMNTEQGIVRPFHNGPVIFGRNTGGSVGPFGPYFTDDGTFAGSSVTGIKYDGVEFGSLAQSFAQSVEVNADGLATVVVGTGEDVYSLNTYNVSTADATSLAQYVQASLDAYGELPLSLTTSDRMTDNYELFFRGAIANNIGLRLRTDDYYSVIIGRQISASPFNTRVTLYLRGQLSYEFLRLDDAVFGKLDENKLGW